MEEGLELGDGWRCRFQNGAWHCTLASLSSPSTNVWILRGADFFDQPLALDELTAFAGRTATVIHEAANYAENSPYVIDIQASGGLVFQCIVADSWDDYKLWFQLANSNQMLAVRSISGRLTDLYCDHP